MGNIAISVENLGKSYRIGHAEKRPENFRAAVRSFAAAPFEYLRSRLREPSEDELFWALKDVSFEVKHGEVLGIIGRNGAGKSTLLKILSRITEPTTGRARVYGRVGSLLEVGTGFHPELTGRENIYLNGTILGMKRAEIAQKFDEIIDFSGIEKFLDTPVKRYSSGMYVRLAFAVAAHLNPEILIVDEVLAVGDAEFQKKCLGKMSDIARHGRTVLFVSHNMPTVKLLCHRALLVKGGMLAAVGTAEQVVSIYEQAVVSLSQTSSQRFPFINTEYGLSVDRIVAVVTQEDRHAYLQIVIHLHSSERLRHIGVNAYLYTVSGIPVSLLGASLTNNTVPELSGAAVWTLTSHNIEQYLTPGEYVVTIEIVLPRAEVLLSAEQIATFHVPRIDLYGTGIPVSNLTHGIVPLNMRLTVGQFNPSVC